MQSSFQKSMLESLKIMETEARRRPKYIKINKSDVRNALGGVFKARRFSERFWAAPPARLGTHFCGNVKLWEPFLESSGLGRDPESLFFGNIVGKRRQKGNTGSVQQKKIENLQETDTKMGGVGPW